ncbi:type I secretion outer membrane protein, TolC family [Methylophaga frappieri]|uniref:Type I secretion outer membrane protein, TolC family n=1 Tax=Methylophaga frappieri (strain ATCC BAA-2434 / DSM 25690 / JAM7) TaxID=754477 RepID=I1YKI2_METFJ|nr:type I secretion outer membrane protein, TolC family [Methylophaga frappieri]
MAQDLVAIYQQVELSDPRLLIGHQNYQIGEARQRQALGELLPQANFSSSLTSTEREVDDLDSFEQFGGERYAISVRQPLFNMERFRSWQRAKSVTEQFGYKRDDTVAKVRLDTIERYFQYLKAKDELNLITEDKADTKLRLEQTQALFDKNLVRITELLEVQSSLDLLEAQEISAEQTLEMARESLIEITGQPVSYVAQLREETNFARPEMSVDELLDRAMLHNPALNALGSEIDAAKKNIQSKRAQHLPTVNLELSKQETDIGFDNTQTPKSDSEVISLSINVPIYSGGVTSARVEESARQLVVSQATLDQTRREIIKELKDMFFGMRSTLRQIEATDKAITSASKSLEAMNRGFELGMSTISDVLDAQKELLSAKRSHQQARYDYVITRARLAFLSGGMDEQVMAEINSWLD